MVEEHIKNGITSLVLALLDVIVQITMFSPTPLQILLLLVYNFGITFVIIYLTNLIIDFVYGVYRDIVTFFKQKKAEDSLPKEKKLLLANL